MKRLFFALCFSLFLTGCAVDEPYYGPMYSGGLAFGSGGIYGGSFSISSGPWYGGYALSPLYPILLPPPLPRYHFPPPRPLPPHGFRPGPGHPPHPLGGPARPPHIAPHGGPAHPPHVRPAHRLSRPPRPEMSAPNSAARSPIRNHPRPHEPHRR